VKHWQETGHVIDRVVRLGQAGRRCALATVTAIEGSAYRRPGAKLLVEDDGSAHGGVSGGCLEEDVRQIGLEVLGSGRARLRHYATGDDETNNVWGFGLGCDGKVDVFVQPVSTEAARDVWTRVRELLHGDSPFALSTPLQEGGGGEVVVVGEAGFVAGAADAELEAEAAAGLRAGRSSRQTLGSRAVFTEVLLPPPKLVVCGAGDDARPLVSYAAAAGFRVVVVDHRSAYLRAERVPEAWRRLPLRPEEPGELPSGSDTCAVVMTHSLKRDTEWVRRLLATDASYIGVLGPRARTARILEELGASAQGRVFGPVGLDLGADGPEQVALSIVAELLAVRAGREPRHLRERDMALHVRR
jgi:xanthine/CO dehydrogenase XdhC/CoxF family maturation factor